MFHHYDRRHLVSADPIQTIERLQKLVEQLSWNKTFGCLTRQALDVLLENMPLEGIAAVFWDIDHLKEANGRWGKPGSSKRIMRSLKMRKSDCLAGQVFSGDEFIAFPAIEDAVPMAQRILDRLRQQDMSATFYITLPHPGETPADLLKRADAGCAFFKDQGLRNAIHFGYGMEDYHASAS